MGANNAHPLCTQAMLVAAHIQGAQKPLSARRGRVGGVVDDEDLCVIEQVLSAVRGST